MITTDFSAGKTPTPSPADDIVYVPVESDYIKDNTDWVIIISIVHKPVPLSSLMDDKVDKTFWNRLLSFVSDVNTGCAMGEEEKDYIINTCNKNLKPRTND